MDDRDHGFGAAYPATPIAPQGALRAGLGCGNPLAVADITPGETVVDLGSGGGLDVILSARRTGPAGKAYGLDASTDMIALAEANARQADVTNVEFLHGSIEDIPLSDGSADVVISNCVLYLSTDKPAAPTGVMIRPMRAADAGQVLAIYQAGLDTGQASFETTAPTWDAFDAARLPEHRHVAIDTATGHVTATASAPSASENASAYTKAPGATLSSSNAAAQPFRPIAGEPEHAEWTAKAGLGDTNAT